MLYRVLIFVCSVGSLSGAAFALAATTTSSTTDTLPEARVADVAAQIEAQTPPPDAAPTNNSPLSPRAQDRLQNLSANLSNRHGAAIDRLRQIHGRLATRRDILAGQGVVTDNATRALTVAQTSLDNAQAALENIDAQIYHFVSSPDPQEQWQETRDIYELSAQAIRDAHTALRIGVNELQQAPRSTNP